MAEVATINPEEVTDAPLVVKPLRQQSGLRPNANALIELFNTLFEERDHTVLLGGADEPVYLPARDECVPAQVIFTQDYVSSALHEVAHWCLAGAERRQQLDYGYWYCPERSRQQQQDFEHAEVRPQALEAVFSDACGHSFRPSYDRLAEPNYRSVKFEHAITAQKQRFLDRGLPPRAALFQQALAHRFVSCTGF